MKNPVLTIISVLFISCGSNGFHTDNKLTIINAEKDLSNFQEVMLSEITDDIQYIPLETNERSLLGQYLYAIRLSNDRIFISDYYQCKVFNINGKYIGNVGSRGKGPGQYSQSINTLSLDRKNEKAYIYSTDMRISEYSFDGEYLRSIAVPNISGINFFSSCYFLDELDLFMGTMTRSSGIEKNMAYFFNDKGAILDSIPNQYYDISDGNSILGYMYALGAHIHNLGSQLLVYRDGFCDTIFHIDLDRSLVPVLNLDFGSKSLKADLLKLKSAREFAASLSDYVYQHHMLTVSKDYVFFDCILGKQYPSSQDEVTVSLNGMSLPVKLGRAFYRKSTDELIFLSNKYGSYGFINDIDGGMSFWPVASSNYKTLISFFSPFALKNWINSRQFKENATLDDEKKSALIDLANSLDESGNPVLMLINLDSQEN